MGNKRATFIFACLIIAAAGAFLFFALREPAPRLDRRSHDALGQVVAREAVKLREGSGRIFLIARDTVAFRSPASDAQLESFFSTLKASGGSVAATNLVKLDPLRVAGIPAGEFFQILKKTSEQDVVVSFLGAPVLDPAQISKLGTQRAKIIAVCTGGTPNLANARQSFDQQLLQVAVISRKDVSPSPPTSSQPQDWFDYLFTLATPSNLTGLPPSAAALR